MYKLEQNILMNRVKMTPDRDDLIGISDSYDVEKILQASLKQQFYSYGMSPSFIDRTPLRYMQDGGIDIAIEVPKSYSIPEVLGIGTNNNIVLQVKHTKGFLNRKEVEEEIKKDAVKKFFEEHNGGTYVICYSKTVPKEGKFAQDPKKKVQDLQDALDKIFKPVQVTGLILYPDDLINWIKKSPASWQYFPSAHTYYFANSRTLSFIKNKGIFTEQFKDEFAGEERREKLNDLKKWINSQNESNYFLEIRGNMGIGKTRLVYEAVKECQLEDLCFWFSDPSGFKPNEIREFLSLQKQSKIKLFYVIDESNATMHSMLLNLTKELSKNIKIISILPFRDAEAEQTGSYIFSLDLMEKEDLHSVINQYTLEESVKNRIVTLCRGYPKLAVLLAQRIAEENPSNINYQKSIELLSLDFKDGTTKKGWIDLILDEKDFKVLSALSCLIEVCREISEDNDEMQCLCDVFEFDRGLTNRVIEKNLKKGLISEHSKYIYVTPSILADHLATEKFKYEKAKIKKLFEKLKKKHRPGFNQSPVKSFLNRYQMITKDNNELKDKYKDLLFDDFDALDILQKKNQAEFILTSARNNPEEFLNSFYHQIQSMDIKAIKQVIEGRRDIVIFLQHSAFYPQFFEISFKILYRLALAENEFWSNNATGIFIQYCYPVFSGSEAHLKQRIYTFIGLLESHYEKSPELFGKCIEIFLQLDGHMIMAGYENQLNIPKITTQNDRRPPSFDEYDKCFNKLWDVLVENFDIRKEKNKPLWNPFCTRMRSLVRLFPPLLENSEKFNYLIKYGKQNFSHEILSSLISIKTFDIKEISKKSSRKKLEAAINELDSGIEALIRRVLFESLSDELPQSGRAKEEQHMTDLVNKFIKDPFLLEKHKDLILSEKSTRNFLLFPKLGNKDKKQVLWKILSKWDQSRLQRGIVCLYIKGFWESNPETSWTDDLLDKFAQNNVYEKELICQISQDISTERSFNRMLAVMKLITLKPGCFGTFGIPLRRYNQKQVEKIIDNAFETWEDEAFTYMIEQLAWYLQEGKSLGDQYKKLVLKSLFTEFTSTMHEYYRFDQLLSFLLEEKNLKEDIIIVFEEVLNNTFTQKYGFETRTQNSKGLEMIAKKYTSETYQIFKKILLKKERHLAFIQLYLRKWLISVYIKYIEEDLESFSLKQFKNILYLGPDGLESLNSLTQYAMKRYEHNEDISNTIANRICFHDEVWRGSTIDHFKRKLNRFSQWAKSCHLEDNKIVKEITSFFQSRVGHYVKVEEDEKFLSRNNDSD